MERPTDLEAWLVLGPSPPSGRRQRRLSTGVRWSHALKQAFDLIIAGADLPLVAVS